MIRDLLLVIISALSKQAKGLPEIALDLGVENLLSGASMQHFKMLIPTASDHIEDHSLSSDGVAKGVKLSASYEFHKNILDADFVIISASLL